MRQDKWNKPFRPGQSEEAKQEQKRNKVKKLEKKAKKLGIVPKAKKLGIVPKPKPISAIPNRIVNRDIGVDQGSRSNIVSVSVTNMASKPISVDFETVGDYWQSVLKSKLDYSEFEKKYLGVGVWPDDDMDKTSLEEIRRREEELRQKEYEVLLRTFERLMEKHKKIMEHWK